MPGVADEGGVDIATDQHPGTFQLRVSKRSRVFKRKIGGKADVTLHYECLSHERAGTAVVADRDPAQGYVFAVSELIDLEQLCLVRCQLQRDCLDHTRTRVRQQERSGHESPGCVLNGKFELCSSVRCPPDSFEAARFECPLRTRQDIQFKAILFVDHHDHRAEAEFCTFVIESK